MNDRKWCSFRTAVALVSLVVVGLACGGERGATAAPTPQQPAAVLQPAPAAPAPDPQAALLPADGTRPSPTTAVPAPKGGLATPKYGGVALLPGRGTQGNFDTMQTSIYFETHIMGAPLFGDGNLVRRCLEDVYKVCPGLAESWELNSDFTQFTFKIRDNVLWHDGKPFTAEDAKFWVELAYFGAKSGEKTRRPAWYKADFGDLQKVEALEGNRLRISLGRPASGFLLTISTPYYVIGHPKHLAQPVIERGEVTVTPQDIGFVGTGPFKFLKYEKGSIWQVRRFDKYWRKDATGRPLPYLDGMDIAFVSDPTAMDAAFRVGRLDAGSGGGGLGLTKERKAGYVKDLGDRVWFAEIPLSSAPFAMVSFNLLKPGQPWSDVRVRRAISLWVEKKDMIDAALGGFGVLAPLMNGNNPYSSPDFMSWPGFNPATRERDKAEAQRLMAEAGYPKGGFQMRYNCLGTVISYRDICQFTQAQLLGLGIDLKLEIQDFAPWTAAGQSPDYDSYQSGSTVSTPLPEAMELILTVYSVSRSAYTKHEDPKVPALFRRINEATSFDERVKLWRELERYYVLEQVLLVPLPQRNSVIPYRSYVTGLVVPAEGVMNYLDFATVWLDK